ncbi:MAG: replication factor C large subunit [Candidatus Aenigmarchaeota archaeon]|nr:replication factor C large subunit [Candidatus Aenigmarchaeota archaeon]
MLVEKYRPKRLVEIVGQKTIVKSITDWLKRWKPGKAFLLYGPTGIGKTLIVDIIAKENKFNLIEINASNKNAASYIREVLMPASKEGSLLNKRLILIDEIDSFSDRGALTEIIKTIKQSASPVIMTANNAYDKKLRTLRNYCIPLRVNRIPVNLIERELNKIALKEKIKISRDVIRRIAMNSDGDIRSAINDLEIFSKDTEFGIRDKKKDIFKILKIIFQANDLGKALQAIDESDKNIDEIFWWIEQNIPKEFKNAEEIAEAFELLSKADLFRSKIIINQNYRFKKYMRDLIAGITLIGNNKKFIMYKPPDRLVILGRTKAMRNKNEELYKNLGNILHCSKRKIKEQMPYLNIFLKK